MNKIDMLKRVKDTYITDEYHLSDVDEHKPWGAYYRIVNEQAQKFVDQFFPGESVQELGRGGSLSPKLLIFQPGMKLSLQYHERRAEIWRVVEGTLEAAISEDDQEGEWKLYAQEERISYDALVRHRAGAPAGGEWVVVAEIWQHTDFDNPTDENDIIRLADDFGRS